MLKRAGGVDPIEELASPQRQGREDQALRRKLERRILETVDRERERMGRELHDGLCQSLAGIAALSSTLSRRLAANHDAAASGQAGEINVLLNEAIVQARGLARGLGPMSGASGALLAAFENFATTIQHLFNVRCTVRYAHPIPALGREAKSHLYRIVQEAVNNALAHGRAQLIEISLGSADGQGVLAVRDDGIGVDADGDGGGTRFQTMTYRAQRIGGRLEVRRRSRHGTSVSCVFSLPALPTDSALDHAPVDI